MTTEKKGELPSERLMRWKRYAPKTMKAKLGLVVEECGEVLAAIGKAQRWGLESFNPEIRDLIDRETNRDWILRELDDLDRASALLRAALKRRR